MAGVNDELVQGTVVKLDRGYPLVRLNRCGGGSSPDNNPDNNPDNTALIRCEHATSLVKGARNRAVIGDVVRIRLNKRHDKGIIQSIEERRTEFVRKDPAERSAKQVLAANFTLVIIAEPLVDLNYRRIERELVLAHETGANVLVVLTKSDLVSAEETERLVGKVQGLAGSHVDVIAISLEDEASLNLVRSRIPAGEIAILIGKSGVGKSSLVNALVGAELQSTASVRDVDGKGRHTTVDRVLIDLPEAGAIVDMPGVRGLGIWDADQGIEVAFADVEELARSCRFRDCTHTDEPGCAVLAAVEEGALHPARLDSYRTLVAEIENMKSRRTEANRARGIKHSTKR